MKVYVVDGYQHDHTILAIFLNKQSAEKFRDEQPDANPVIVEYEAIE